MTFIERIMYTVHAIAVGIARGKGLRREEFVKNEDK